MNPEAVLDALTAVGIDFSVSRSDLLDWLGNPEFTEYPAFAAALLQLLGGQGLQRPVFIDVIVGFYEQSPGNPSPRRVEGVDTELLKQATLDGSNERYGEQATEFAALLKPAGRPAGTLFSGMPERRRVIREARRQREAAWRERYNTEALADDLWERTRTMRDDFAASVFGQPFVETRNDAQNAKTWAANRAEEAEHHVEDVDAAWDTDAASNPLWPDGGGDLPLMLLPVRLETLFRPSASGGAELWIRVYPDDIHIDGHETALTAAERAAGEHYWSVAGAPGADADARAAGWAAVVAAVGPTRGLWAVECLRPGGDGADSKDTTWTRAPLTRLMPHHFTFSAYREGRLMWRVDGAPVPDELPAGFAPPAIEQHDEDEAPAAGTIPWQRASKWLVDFDEAVGVGMAVRVPLADPNLHYDLLTAVGVGDADPDTAARRVEQLLIAHAYTDGLSVLPTGTPTNNTPGSRSGWQSRAGQRSPDELDSARGALPTAGPGVAANRIAAALGIDAADTVAPIPGGQSDPDDLAAPAHRFMAGLLGNLSVDWLPVGSTLGKVSNDLGFLADHFTSFVRSRGPLPVLRVGRQPYGILPVTPIDLWRGDDVNEAIAYVMSSVLSYYKENTLRAQRVGSDRDQDAAILDLLSRRPASTRVRYISDTKTDLINRQSRAYPPATVGIAMADMNMMFSARGPIGAAPAGFDFTAAVDPTPELLEFVASRPLQLYAEVVNETQTWRAGVPEGGQAEWPPELIEKMKAVNASTADLDPATSGLFYQLAFPLFRTMWWLSLLYGYPSRMPADHEARPTADALAQSIAAALELETIAVQRLAGLERALCECLDTASHRIDAWATSLATARLEHVRADHPTGLRTGAYGWVCDLAPLSPGSRPARDGYLVTPSMQHATTAAVLRAGCLAHSDPTAFSVNLSSARVRKALRTLEGIKQGQSLDYLLGYRFERALHDRSMDQLIPAFRARYPIAPQVNPEADGAGVAQAAVAARYVVDGLALSRDLGSFDAGAPTVPVGAELLPAVRELVADLVDTFDAVGDLLLAESVHHIVGGNPLRAGLAADAASRGLLPDDFAVISTPRSADTVAYAFGAVLTDVLVAGGGWGADNGLAELEPALENWCRTRLGPPDGWVFGCRRADGSASTAALTALGAGALETVRTVDAGSQSICARRLLAAAGAVEFTDEGAGRYEELVTLAESLRSVIATSTPLLASHFDPVADPWAVADLDELAGRIDAWSTRVQQAATVLRQEPADAADVATATRQLIGCGLAIPAGTDLSDADQLARLAAKLSAAVTDAKLPEQRPEPPSGNGRDSTSTLEWVSRVTAPVTALTGGGIPVLPRLQLGGSGIDALLDPQHRPTGATGDDLADWIRDIGRVRPAVRSVDDTLTAAELIAGRPSAGFVVTQAPAAADPPWIAVNRGTARASTVLATDGDLGGATLTGLVFDAWSEALPREGRQPGTADEVAGVAFHTARPDSRAPQAILLAVPPDRSRGWHAEDVHAAVEEAFELAQVRGMDLADLPELRAMMPPTVDGGDFTVNLPA